MAGRQIRDKQERKKVEEKVRKKRTSGWVGMRVQTGQWFVGVL